MSDALHIDKAASGGNDKFHPDLMVDDVIQLTLCASRQMRDDVLRESPPFEQRPVDALNKGSP
jgi:hypothetical protein